MEYIKIRNWDKWQTYRKDRGQPPWIKVHRCVMRNPEWVMLTDAERGQLVAMWLLAADHDGAIPASAGMVKKLCFMETKPNFNKFYELGFLDAKVTPQRRQHDQPKAEAEADTDKKQNKYSSDFEKFYFAYPLKKSKKAAFKAWNKLNTHRPPTEKLIQAVENQKKEKANLIANNKFCPEWKHPSTWLNNGCWEDECTIEKTETKTSRHITAENVEDLLANP